MHRDAGGDAGVVHQAVDAGPTRARPGARTPRRRRDHRGRPARRGTRGCARCIRRAPPRGGRRAGPPDPPSRPAPRASGPSAAPIPDDAPVTMIFDPRSSSVSSPAESAVRVRRRWCGRGWFCDRADRHLVRRGVLQVRGHEERERDVAGSSPAAASSGRGRIMRGDVDVFQSTRRCRRASRTPGSRAGALRGRRPRAAAPGTRRTSSVPSSA